MSRRLQEVKKKLEDEFKTKVLTYKQDMGKMGVAIQLYKQTKEDNLNISVLINNAGIGLVGSTDKIDLQRDESMMILNVINLVELCKLYISDMYIHGTGKLHKLKNVSVE